MKNNKVSLQNLEDMIDAYKAKYISDESYLASEYYEVEELKEILNNPKCKGIRIFNVLKSDAGKNQNRLVIVPMDENGKMIVSSKYTASSISAAAVGIGLSGFTIVAVAEHGQPCPPDCLNTPKLI